MAQLTSPRASSGNGCRSGSASNSSSKTGRARAAISRPRPSCARPLTATRCSWSVRRKAINATFYNKLNFHFIRDITPVAGIIRVPNVMVVNPSVPAKTVPEFIAYAKASPGKISMASAGIGSGPHVAGELFKMMTGVDMVHVPYRGGGPALTDLIAGQVQVIFPTTVSSIGYIRAGRLRALAVTTATRSDALPDIPTVAEFLPGYEASVWYGVGVPKNTPAEIVDKLNKEINAALADPKMKARLADLGGTPLPGSSADFAKLIAEETEKWGKVIRAANIKPSDHARRSDRRRNTGGRYETSPPKAIPASRRGRCRAAGRVADRAGANLSVAAGAHHCRICPRWWQRHHGTPDRTMVVGAARPAIRHREPAGCRH